ncbi:High-affinity glucose transporter [Paramyrothecium foliicola]|nr:High-affinity glucose transporter [Paramyrothecium foliicola]
MLLVKDVVRLTCNRCRSKKTKVTTPPAYQVRLQRRLSPVHCNGARPCCSCARNSIECVYTTIDKTSARILELERKLSTSQKVDAGLRKLLTLVFDRARDEVVAIVGNIHRGEDPEGILRRVEHSDARLQINLVPEARYRYEFPFRKEMPAFLMRSWSRYLRSPYGAVTLVEPHLADADLSRWTMVPSSSDFLHRLIQLYFLQMWSVFTQFHKGLFLQDLRAGRQRFCNPLLVNVILAAAQRVLEPTQSWALLILNQTINEQAMDEISYRYLVRAVEMAKRMALLGPADWSLSADWRVARDFTAWAVFSWQGIIRVPDSSQNPAWYGELWVRYPLSPGVMLTLFPVTYYAQLNFRIVLKDLAVAITSTNSIERLTLSQRARFYARPATWYEELPPSLQAEKITLPSQLGVHPDVLFAPRVRYVQDVAFFFVTNLCFLAICEVQTSSGGGDGEGESEEADEVRSTLILASKGVSNQGRCYYLAEAMLRTICMQLNPRDVATLKQRLSMDKSGWQLKVASKKDPQTMVEEDETESETENETGALFGFDISSMSAFIANEQYLEYFNHPNSATQGGITASMSGGSLVGALLAGWFADRWGRRGALMLAALIFIIGAVLQASSQNVGHLIAGRVVSGFAIGITSSQVIVYLSELAPASKRGSIVGIQQWAIEWGILIMYLISYGCSVTIHNPNAFRIAWGVQAIPAAILLAALFFFPESPRWLANHDRWEEAHEVLAHLHAKGDRHDAAVIAELDEVREAVRIAQESKDIGYLGLFGPKVWKHTVVGVSVQIWQQLLGGNVMLYYLVYIFQMAGLSGNVALTSSIIQYVIFLVTTGAILPFIDRVSRRWLLIGGAIVCSVIHFTTGGVMASYGNAVDSVDGNDILKWSVTGAPAKGIIAMCYIFVGVYGLTWAPVAWIYAGEVFPLRYRAKGVGLAAAGNWSFNLALAYFVPPSFTNIQWRSYMIFGTFCFVMIFHVFFMYPETAGLSLEEIEQKFAGPLSGLAGGEKGGFARKVAAVREGKESAFNESNVETRETV